MTYLDNHFAAAMDVNGKADRQREPLIVCIDDETDIFEPIRHVCECLGVEVEQMSTDGDLCSVLCRRTPMAVVAELDGPGQDGCHVLMTIADYDRHLPVLLVTGEDPAMLGAVDAVEEIWRLTSVTKWPCLLGVGDIVDFLFRASRKGRCMRLMPV